MVFDKSVSDPANITISEDSDFLNRLITSGFYRVLCKSAMGGGEVFVCRLKEDNSKLRCVHDLAVKRGIRGVLYEKRLCYSNDEQNPMRKPNTGMIDDILMKCKDTVMRGMNFSQLKGCSLMVGDASGLPGQFSDSDKVCAENAGIDYMDVITFVGK